MSLGMFSSGNEYHCIFYFVHVKKSLSNSTLNISIYISINYDKKITIYSIVSFNIVSKIVIPYANYIENIYSFV